MSEELIYGIIFIKFDQNQLPVLLRHYPDTISETIMKGVRVHMVMASEQDISSDLEDISFPALQLKGLGKYVRGLKVSLDYALVLLYNEADDLIYYKYKNNMQPLFDELCNEIGVNPNENQDITSKLKHFNDSLDALLAELQDKEMVEQKSQEESTEAQEIDYRFKMVVAGDLAVGKTSVVVRFTDNAFKRNYLPTIGANIVNKNIKINETLIQLVIWDLAGHAKFETMRRHFYVGMEGVFLVFDLTNPTSFHNLEGWFTDMQNFTKPSQKLVGFIIGNKNDLENARQVVKGDGMKLADKIEFEYIETSALSGDNIEYAFTRIAQKLLDTKSKNKPSRPFVKF